MAPWRLPEGGTRFAFVIGAEHTLALHLFKTASFTTDMTPTLRETNDDAAITESSLREPLESLSAELGRISEEIQSINSGFQTHIQQALAAVQSAIEAQYRARLEECIAELREQLRTEIREEVRKDFEAALTERAAEADTQKKEIDRAYAELEAIALEIATMLEDASVELSRVMQKRKDHAELKAYIQGLRFSK